jgi:DNA-binding IclR family transcriptional regulator
MLVLCVVGDRTLSAKNGPDKPQAPKEPVNLQFIADHSGIPRETVRRKLQDLMALGWVQKDERGNFAATRKAATDLAPLVEISVNYLAKMKAFLSPK